MTKTKKNWKHLYAHIDMMGFFAAVEQHDFPLLAGKPVVVTNGDKGTTIITASYEARAFGIKTGIKLHNAIRRCPKLIRQPSRPDRYVAISQRIMHALRNISPDQEVFSIDECFLYLTPVRDLYQSLEHLAHCIRQEVFIASGGLPCSIGISEGKLTAKLAAKCQKGATTVLSPEACRTYISTLPVSEICGIGPNITHYLHQHGVFYCGELKNHPTLLSRRFGRIGERLYAICQGHDPEPIITTTPPPKSMGHGKVLPPKTTDINLIRATLAHQVEKLTARLRQHHLNATRIDIGLKYTNGWHVGQYHPTLATNQSQTLWSYAKQILATWTGEPVFQVQITAKNLLSTKVRQYDLFERENTNGTENQIDSLKDTINLRFGKNTLIPATMLQAKDNSAVISPSWRPSGPSQSI